MRFAPQFSLRALFVVTTLSSMVAVMLRSGEWRAAVGFSAAALLTLCAVRLLAASRGRRVRQAIGCVLLVGAAPVAWFSMVDWSWFVSDCPDCRYGNDVWQYRICTVPIYATMRESPSLTQRVAEDLGVPCNHGQIVTWHKHKLWGLLVCKWPCINGISRITYMPSWYDRQASEKVAALAAVDDNIQNEFIQTVFVDHDFAFVLAVLQRAGVETPDTE